MPSIQVNGATINYLETGKGPLVVLLHSSVSSGKQWRALADLLDDEFRLLAPDLYGYGDTDDWPGGGDLTLADEAAAVQPLFAQVPGPVHLVGHSYGGAVAVNLALAYAGRFSSLTLFEPVSFYLLRGGGAEDQRLLDEIGGVAAAVEEAIQAGDPARGMAGFVDYWNGEGAWAALADEYRDSLARRTGKVALDFRCTIGDPSALGDCRALDLPTLILRGADSPAPTRRIAELLSATIPGASLETVAGAGHMAPLNDPGRVNGPISEHLRCHR
jgi:pimeloyl-ACP methyl ester carboxylesterase